MLLSAVFSAVVVCTMEGSSMVDGRESEREWCVRVSVGAALLCGGRCGQVGSRVQILIGYEPKDSFIPLLLVCSRRPNWSCFLS